MTLSASNKIMLSTPSVGPLEEEAVLRALRSGWVAPAGPELSAFEAELAAQCGRRHAVALVSGSAALHLALLAYGVQPGDVVCCATLTFAATVNAVAYVGAAPLLIDADESGNLDPVLLRLALADCARRGRRVGAVIPVDLLGKIADHETIARLCAEFCVPLVVDAAESLGAIRDGRPAGSHGDAAIISFNGNKIITTSGGGAFLCDDAETAARVRHLSTQARMPAAHYEHEEIGFNYRMSNVLAALGRAQLARLPEFLAARRRHRDAYRRWTQTQPGVEIFGGPTDAGDNCWLTAILIDPVVAGFTCTELAAELDRHEIENRPMWKPMHDQPVHAGVPALLNGTSDRMFAQGLVLPSGSDLREDQRFRVIEIIDRFAAQRRDFCSWSVGSRRPRTAHFDCVIIGGGASAAMLVENMIDRARRHGRRSLRVGVAEKSGQFWTGVPFGHRSGDQALIISNLEDFVPEVYRGDFADYLARHDLPYDGEAYLPRVLFGRFLAERLDGLTRAAASELDLVVEQVAAEVVDCRPAQAYELVLDDQRTLTADRVVIATGSPPQRRLDELIPALRHTNLEILDDLYSQDFSAVMSRANEVLAEFARRRSAQLALVGSQASGLEVLNHLDPALDLQVTVFSRSAEFPHRTSGKQHSGPPRPLTELDRLRHVHQPSAAQIMQAVAADMAALDEQGLPRSEAITLTGARIGELVSRLPQDQAQAFVNEVGPAIGRWHRRAGGSYRAGLERLERQQRIGYRAARFDPSEVAVLTSAAGTELISTRRAWEPVRADLIINAMGFTAVERSPGLLSRLCRTGLVRPTPSHAGVCVDEDFQARPGLYVFGPLLAGNASGSLRIWHLESVRRVSMLAGRLAETLIGA